MSTKKKKQSNILLELKNIKYDINNLAGNTTTILNKINLSIYRNQITGIIGKSGSGKSTLLKIIAGLLPPDKGRIKYPGAIPPKVTIVFEDFALFPWLNVEENIELGLKSSHVSSRESYIRVNEILDLIGLGGYEQAYPKELSAGMKQRVSFARALISEPDILLLDEPFATLDTPTAEALKNDLLNLWTQKMINTKAIILVTHNVSDIAKLCSNVAVLKNRPATIYSQFSIKSSVPRKESSKQYEEALAKVYATFSEPTALSDENSNYKEYANIIGANIKSLIGFLSTLVSEEYEGKADIADISDNLQLELDSLLPILELSKMLNFIKIADGVVKITTWGRAFASEKNSNRQKSIFASHLTKYADLAGEVVEHYHQSLKLLLDKLANQVTPEEGQQILDTLVSLAKYGRILRS